MSTCKTCQHWLPYEEQTFGVHGICSRVPTRWSGFTPQYAHDFAAVVRPYDDDGWWDIPLVTRHDFGCNQHEPVGRSSQCRENGK